MEGECPYGLGKSECSPLGRRAQQVVATLAREPGQNPMGAGGQCHATMPWLSLNAAKTSYGAIPRVIRHTTRGSCFGPTPTTASAGGWDRSSQDKFHRGRQIALRLKYRAG